MDIVSIEGMPKTKRGKFSGEKNVFRCPHCHKFLVSTREEEICPFDNSPMESMFKKIIDGGNVIYKEDLDKERKYVIDQLGWMQ